MPPFKLSRCSRLLGLLAPAGAALAQNGAAPTVLAPVVVTATRTEVSPFDVPASIDRIDGDYFTILGLPLPPLLEFLRTRGLVET